VYEDPGVTLAGLFVDSQNGSAGLDEERFEQLPVLLLAAASHEAREQLADRHRADVKLVSSFHVGQYLFVTSEEA